jgi:2-polyprenyl-3-methyl-5-hydroxy-6-metoxy-1,4-benzoquinol methylase
MERDRTRARQLAAEYLAKGDPVGWFEQLYREGEQDKSVVPWAELGPNPNLLDFWRLNPLPADGKSALLVGCGFGDDAEQLASWGFDTTAFDVSATAIQACRRRFPSSPVHYQAADLLAPPPAWIASFDFVLESYTLQVLPPPVRAAAIRIVSEFVAPGGLLLLIARGRDEHDPEGQMPWPLLRRELEDVAQYGLRQLSFEDFPDAESPPVRRFRALYQKP